MYFFDHRRSLIIDHWFFLGEFEQHLLTLKYWELQFFPWKILKTPAIPKRKGLSSKPGGNVSVFGGVFSYSGVDGHLYIFISWWMQWSRSLKTKCGLGMSSWDSHVLTLNIWKGLGDVTLLALSVYFPEVPNGFACVCLKLARYYFSLGCSLLLFLNFILTWGYDPIWWMCNIHHLGMCFFSWRFVPSLNECVEPH